MEDLHPLVRAILRGLLEGPLYALAEDVIARLSPSEDDVPGDMGEDDAPWRREGPASKLHGSPAYSDGMGQLLVLDEVIGDWLERELAITRAMPGLAGSLGLQAVSFDRLGGVNLADEDREMALQVFAKRYRSVVAQARAAMGGDDGDLR